MTPKGAHSLGTRGAIYEKLGQRDKAIADYRAALEIDPSDQFAKDWLKRLGVTP